MKTWPAPKDPDEIKDYSINWKPLVGRTDTVSTSEWSIADGDDVLDIESDTSTDTTTTVWLSGGTVDTAYELLNRVTTTGGRTYDQTVRLRCKAK